MHLTTTNQQDVSLGWTGESLNPHLQLEILKVTLQHLAVVCSTKSSGTASTVQ